MTGVLWNHESLLSKAQLCFARASREDRGSSVFGMWMGFGVEHLARAALAAIHPALLADPQDGKNILYAFGVETKAPRSIPMKTVLGRCVELVEGFSGEHHQSLVALLELRNTELHSGHSPFDDISTTVWYLPTLRAVKVLGQHLGQSLSDLIGPDEARLGEQMIEEASADLRAEVLRLIAHHRVESEGLSEAELAERSGRGLTQLKLGAHWSRTSRRCPACGATSEVAGYIVRELPPQLEDGAVVERSVFLPVESACPICKLALRGHEKLVIAGLGDAFTEAWESDPEEYFGERFLERYSGGEEYGND